MGVLDKMLIEKEPPYDIFLSCKIAYCSAYKLRNSIEGQQALVNLNNITLGLSRELFDAKDYLSALEASILGKRFAESINDNKVLHYFLNIINNIAKSDPKLKNAVKEIEVSNDAWIKKICS